MPTTSSEHDRYILHLNHALAMEYALVEHLEKRAAALSDPQARQHILRHRDETVQHREAVREIIVSLGGEPTSAKAVVQSPISTGIVGKVISALESEKEDRRLADDLTDYAVESYEAALYSALILIARNLGYAQHAGRFEEIRQQERDMAGIISSGQLAAIREAFPPMGKAA